MYIKKIEIDNFGCLKDKTLFLDKTFNLIYGSNESGKSTLFSFVIYIFYGTKIKKIPGELTFKEKYMPWNGMPMSGRITFEYDGKEYIISRLTSEFKNEISLFCISNGEEIRDRSILASPGSYFWGMGIEAVYRSIYISSSQSTSSVMSADGIISGLSDTYDTQSFKVSYAHITDIIKDRLSELNSPRKKNALIPHIDRQILTVKNKISKIQTDTSMLSDLEKRNNVLKDELDELSKVLESEKSFVDDVPVSNEKSHMILFVFSVICIVCSLALLIIKPVFYSTFLGTVMLIASFAYACYIWYKTFLQRKDYERKLFTLQTKNDKIVLLTENIYKLKTEHAMNCEQIRVLKDNLLKTGEYESDLDSLEEKRRECFLELDALELALDALEIAFSDCRSMYVPELSKLTGSHLSEITQGDHPGALIDDLLSLSVSTDKGYRNVLSLSQGGREQAYFAMRIALSDMLMSGDNPVPLFLDDALAFYDDFRCTKALDILLSLSKSKQVFYCTCRKNEFTYLSNKNIGIFEF